VETVALRALVVDLDGTVWDSFPWLARVVGRGDPEAEREAFLTLRDEGLPAARLLDQAGVTRAQFRSICAEARDFEPYAGVAATLAHLHERSVPLGVVTNLPGWIAKPMLDCVGLSGFFDSVADYARTRRRKPDPAPILAVLAELGVEPDRSIWYAGDTATDAVAAERAGISFAWASYGYGDSAPPTAAMKLSAFRDLVEL